MHHSLHCKYVCLRGTRAMSGTSLLWFSDTQRQRCEDREPWVRIPRVATGFHQISQDVLQDCLIPFIFFFFITPEKTSNFSCSLFWLQCAGLKAVCVGFMGWRGGHGDSSSGYVRKQIFQNDGIFFFYVLDYFLWYGNCWGLHLHHRQPSEAELGFFFPLWKTWTALP